MDADQFRHVIGHLASGVTVVTTETGGRRYGMTASSVTSVSTDPPMMLVCINKAVPTAAAVTASGRFVVNVLGEHQGELARQFAAATQDKFRGISTYAGSLGQPMLREALAHLECQVVEPVSGGTHTIFLARVVSATARVGQPLTYFRGGFGRFEFARENDVHAGGRALGKTPGAPQDDLPVDETFDARLAIELGVIALAMPRVTAEEVGELRRRFDVMAAMISDDRFVDFKGYLDANDRLHAYVVSLAHNPLLTTTFGILSIKSVMARAFGSTPVTSQRFIDVQRRLVEAFEFRDAPAAGAAAVDYCCAAKERARELIALAGDHL